MELNEARNVLRNLTSQFRAFEKLGEVMDMAIDYEGRIGGMEKELKKLEKRKAQAEDAAVKVESAVQEASAKAADKILAAQKSAEDKIARAKEEAFNVETGLKQAAKQLHDELHKERKAGATEIAELKAEAEKWQNKLADAQKAYDRLKSKVA